MMTKYFGFIFAILFLYIPLVAKAIDCSINALTSLNLSNRGINFIEGTFWTIKFIGSTAPYNFPSNGILARYSQFMTAERTIKTTISTYTFNPEDKRGTYILQINRYGLTLDGSRSVFKVNKQYQKWDIIKVGGKSIEYGDSVYLQMPVAEEFTFALVFVGNNDSFRIYQACKGQYAWIQISDDEMQKCKKKRCDATHILDREIRDALAELSVPVNYIINAEIRDNLPLLQYYFSHL